MKDKFVKGANDNVIYTTSGCSNRCIMCCQPPCNDSDVKEIEDRNMAMIQNSSTDVDYVCITGGEPTLIGNKLFDYISEIRKSMPHADIHLLTNGRKFSDRTYLRNFYKYKDDNMVIGIPLHSDNYIDHDKIAGAKGAFYETISGLQNLGLLDFEIELRIIIMKCNYQRLKSLAEFVTLNLPFVSQVSFMGLEMTGYAVDNINDVWIEPSDYIDALNESITILENSEIKCKIFNVPLCLLPTSLWRLSCKSISSWKKTNLRQCKKCSQIENCCGVFNTSKILYKSIHNL